jgi:hypothetical protein
MRGNSQPLGTVERLIADLPTMCGRQQHSAWAGLSGDGFARSMGVAGVTFARASRPRICKVVGDVEARG